MSLKFLTALEIANCSIQKIYDIQEKPRVTNTNFQADSSLHQMIQLDWKNRKLPHRITYYDDTCRRVDKDAE
jgi:hypothetical protein